MIDTLSYLPIESEVDTFYAQLKTEVVQGWFKEPQIVKMWEKQVRWEQA
jgi:hypothetical protein